MAEGFGDIKQKPLGEQRRLADAMLEHGFTALAKALQEVGLCALVSKASDRELRIINTRIDPRADGEFQRIIEHAIIEICSAATEDYVLAARRALRFDEEGSNG